MIHILVADGVPLFRCGIRSVLASTSDCEVVGEAMEHASIMQLLQEQHPDVMLLDAGLLMPDALCEVAHALNGCRLVVLTASADEEQLFQFQKLGAAAYESRGITAAYLTDRIRRVVQQEYLLSLEAIGRSQPPLSTAPVTSPTLKRGRSETHEPVFTYPLSGREVEILDHIARGNSNKEIAKLLLISDQTVKNHITSILQKLAVHDRTAAVVYALRRHWISLEEPRRAPGDSEAARTFPIHQLE